MEKARELQDKTAGIVAILRKYGEIPVAKAIMGFLGVDCGPARLPARTLTAEDLAVNLRRDLEEIDFFSYASRCIS